MSETVAVAMATAHCNTLFAARPPMLAAASKPVRASGGGGGARCKDAQDGAGWRGSAAGSGGMLMILSPRFVLHYAGDNAQDNKGRAFTCA